jgi:hypothetical protein
MKPEKALSSEAGNNTAIVASGLYRQKYMPLRHVQRRT